jgi:hypothetical protein
MLEDVESISGIDFALIRTSNSPRNLVAWLASNGNRSAERRCTENTTNRPRNAHHFSRFH